VLEGLGCNFIKAVGEYADSSSAIHQFSTWHKQCVETLITTVLANFAPSEQELLATQICMVIDGAIVRAQPHGDKGPIESARHIIFTLLEATNNCYEH